VKEEEIPPHKIIRDPNGTVRLESRPVDLKIDTNRKVYRRWKIGDDQTKEYKRIGRIAKNEFTQDEKIATLINAYIEGMKKKPLSFLEREKTEDIGGLESEETEEHISREENGGSVV